MFYELKTSKYLNIQCYKVEIDANHAKSWFCMNFNDVDQLLLLSLDSFILSRCFKNQKIQNRSLLRAYIEKLMKIMQNFYFSAWFCMTYNDAN